MAELIEIPFQNSRIKEILTYLELLCFIEELLPSNYSIVPFSAEFKILYFLPYLGQNLTRLPQQIWLKIFLRLQLLNLTSLTASWGQVAGY